MQKETDRKSSFWYSRAACVSFAICVSFAVGKGEFEPVIWYNRSWCIAMAVNVARTASEPSFRKMMCLATLWRPTKSGAARGFLRGAFGLSVFYGPSFKRLFHREEVYLPIPYLGKLKPGSCVCYQPENTSRSRQ
jgi:hypothetical protein